jgi:hypothetical protein
MFKELPLTLHDHFQKGEEGRNLYQLILKPLFPSFQNQTKVSQEQKTTDKVPVSTDARITNKTSANRTEQNIKRLTHYSQVQLILRMQG